MGLQSFLISIVDKIKCLGQLSQEYEGGDDKTKEQDSQEATGGAWGQGSSATQPRHLQGNGETLGDKGGVTICEAFFFPDKGMPCRSFMEGRRCNRPNCEYMHEPSSLTKLLGYIARAKSTLDICVFTITCNEIADAISAASRRGVKVRIITDNDQAKSQGSDVERLSQQGIPVRMDKDEYHMHHKFAIIDNSILVNGSFNWTRAAVLSNQENVTVTAIPALTQQFTNQFNRLWAKFG